MDQNYMPSRPGQRLQTSSTTKDRLLDSAPRESRRTTTPLKEKPLPPPPSYEPPSYQMQVDPRDPVASKFDDSAANTELPPIRSPSAQHDVDSSGKLPSLSSLTRPPIPRPPIPGPPPKAITASPKSEAPLPKPKPKPKQWPSMNPLTTYYTPSHARAASPAKMELDTISENESTNSNSNGAGSPGQGYDSRGPSVSLDDPDVRQAAEALSGLRADFVNSPPARNSPLPMGSPVPSITSRSVTGSHTPHQEPLLTLLTTSHPFVTTTIEGATSAYNNSKNFSPRFKNSAEYVEGYLTPLANTVNSVGRVTGVEGGVRWFLGDARKSSDLESGGDHGSHKRRKLVQGEAPTVEPIDPAVYLIAAAQVGAPDSSRDSWLFRHDRRISRASTIGTIETLPAYDDHRSPAYTESDKPNGDRPLSTISTASMGQSRLVASTSGLAISMSQESLRSLKYCLGWLRKANIHIGGVVTNLKTTLDQYDRAGSSSPSMGGQTDGQGGMPVEDSAAGAGHPLTEEDRTRLAAKIVALRHDIVQSLQNAIATVSKYTGGALPENARQLVHRHLVTLPVRFRYAAMQDQQQSQSNPDMPREEMTRESANRVLVLAKEGLDMITQVSGVIDGTIVSAEEWCEKVGRKRKEASDSGLPETEPMTDVKAA